MTISHLFFNRGTVDASTNLQAHERNQAKEKPDEKIMIGYNPQDAAFRELVKAVVLGTYTVFMYSPTDDEAKQLIARIDGVPVANFEGKTMDEERMKDAKGRLIAAEKDLLYIHRHCKGDASETGLVQFGQAVMDLDETRNKFPTYTY